MTVSPSPPRPAPAPACPFSCSCSHPAHVYFLPTSFRFPSSSLLLPTPPLSLSLSLCQTSYCGDFHFQCSLVIPDKCLHSVLRGKKAMQPTDFLIICSILDRSKSASVRLLAYRVNFWRKDGGGVVHINSPQNTMITHPNK